MQSFEYKVIPAPTRGQKAKGLKTTEDRFANALTQLMNEMATDGWQFQRSETLPCEERSGLTGKAVKSQNVLVFRRETSPASVTPTRVEPKIVSARGPIVLSSSTEMEDDPEEEAK